MTRLSEDELQLSAEAEANGKTFSMVTPSMLFSANANYGLAMKVRTENPARYRALKQEWEYESGQTPRPDSYWHTNK
jgi:hypothetical protein